MEKSSVHRIFNSFIKEDSETTNGELENIQKIIKKKALVSPYVSIITLNISILYSPIRKHKWLNKLKKTKTHLYDAYKRLTSA